MYLKRLTAQVTAIAIGCASTAIYADANYTQRAKEQAERAAAAAAIAELPRRRRSESPGRGAIGCVIRAAVSLLGSGLMASCRRQGVYRGMVDTTLENIDDTVTDVLEDTPGFDSTLAVG